MHVIDGSAPRLATTSVGVLARRTLAIPLRAVGLAALCLGLGACVAETEDVRMSPAKGVPIEESLGEFAIAVATAETIDDYCRPYGLRKAFSNSDKLAADYAFKLRAQGYSQAEIAAAADRLNDGNTANLAIKRLQARGVQDGDVASLCRYGKEEIAKGSAIGQLLRAKP